MKNLFEPGRGEEMKRRIAQLRPETAAHWGKMEVAQMLAHVSTSLEFALGDSRPPRMFLGYLLGGIVKRRALGSDDPMPRNAPTAPTLRIAGEREFAKEHQRLLTLVDRFTSGGPPVCSSHPHTFFGALTPEEWSMLMYKHLDHHLRQFGV